MNYPVLELIIRDEKGRVVHRVISSKRGRILIRFNLYYKRNFTATIKVRYAKGYSNEGTYKTKKDFMQAYRAFTQKDLIKEFV